MTALEAKLLARCKDLRAELSRYHGFHRVHSTPHRKGCRICESIDAANIDIAEAEARQENRE